MPVTIKALKKENNGLRNQIDALTKELKNLQARIDGKLTKETLAAIFSRRSGGGFKEYRVPWP